MSSAPSILRRSLWLAASSIASILAPLHAQPAQPVQPAAATSLVTNSNLELDANSDGWPDGWPKLKAGGFWEIEDGNHFIRMTSTEPGSTVMLYSEIPLPEGTTALELTWRQRISGLKPGPKAWFDARIMLEFMDGSRAKVSPGAPAPFARKDTKGWEEKRTQFLVPAQARHFKVLR